MKENNYAFIDGTNVHMGIRDQGWELDYKKFRVYLRDKYSVTNAYIFLGHIPTYTSLYTTLQQYGFILVFKPTLRDATGKVKGNCDADMVLHAMIEYLHYDKAVIVSGDGDFYSLVEHLEKNGKLKMLLVPNLFSYSALLKKVARSKLSGMNLLNRKIGT